MNKLGILSGIALILVALFGAWASGMFEDKKYSDDPEVAELEKLRDETLEQSEEERREMRSEMRERVEALTPEQRESFFESSMPIFVKMGAAQMEKRFDEFLAMSPQEQRVALDKRIDEQLERERKRKSSQANTQDRPRRGPPNMTPEKMDEFRKKMQDWTTPEQRAKFETVMKMFNERREERGLEPVKGPWR